MSLLPTTNTFTRNTPPSWSSQPHKYGRSFSSRPLIIQRLVHWTQMDFDVRRQTSPLRHRYMLMRFVLGSHMANGLSAYRAKESVSELLAATCTCMLTTPY